MIDSKKPMLAFTTAVLLKSSLPFMLLSLLCTAISATSLTLFEHTWAGSRVLLIVVLILALPLAWLSLRTLVDAAIMKQWARGSDEQTYQDFDRSLKELGIAKTIQARDLAARARACLGLQKKLLFTVAAQWSLFVVAMACAACNFS
jgi:hypothetical protein